MKNIKLITFLFYLALLPFMPAARGSLCKSLLFAQEKTLPFSLDLRTDYKYKPLSGKQDFLSSGKISLPFVELKGAVDWADSKTETNRYNYGLAFNTQKLFKNFEATVLTGNLSASGSISRLNSPELSQTVSWTSSSVKLQKLNASLPQYNVFSKPHSLYAMLSIGDKKGSFNHAEINNFWNGENLTASFDTKFLMLNKTVISFGITGGLYPYKKTNESSWFTKNMPYHEGKHLCALGELCISGKSFDSLFILNAYESPFGKIDFTYRTENYFKFRHFAFNFAAFYNPNNKIITSSQKELSPMAQLRTSGQYQFAAGSRSLLMIKTGFGAQAEINLAEQEHSLMTNGGFQLTGERLSFSFNTKLNFGIKSGNTDITVDFSGGSVNFSTGFFIGALKPQASFVFSFVPNPKKDSWTFTEKTGVGLGYTSNIIDLNVKGNINLEQKNGQTKRNISGSIGLKLEFDWFSLKFDFDIEM